MCFNWVADIYDTQEGKQGYTGITENTFISTTKRVHLHNYGGLHIFEDDPIVDHGDRFRQRHLPQMTSAQHISIT